MFFLCCDTAINMPDYVETFEKMILVFTTMALSYE